jgi:hypothetical protein
MYVRFVVAEIDENSGCQRGIFQAMYRLWRRGGLAPHEEAWWAELRAWLDVDLDEPTRFARSRRPGANAAAISWFKDSATGHIGRAREVVHLLEQHNITSQMLTTERPGYIVYEDKFQIVAEPFRGELP